MSWDLVLEELQGLRGISTTLKTIEADLVTIKTQQTAILTAIQKGETQIMAGIKNITDGQTVEKADLAILTGLIPQLLTAFASGAMTPAQAQDTLDEINAEDATIKSNIASIQAALPTPPAPGPASGA